MRWRWFASVVMTICISMALTGLASALTAGEEACCGAMDDLAIKYFNKHTKKAGKCTGKMNDSTDPAAEKCDDNFDINTGDTDFVIDKFGTKFLKKMKKKCIKKLGITETTFGGQTCIGWRADGPPHDCSCCLSPALSLQSQMECKLDLQADPADEGICNAFPPGKNANRGFNGQPPPGDTSFCP